MAKGQAYVFLRKDGAPVLGAYGGHVGWGFWIPEARNFYCGATENPGNAPIVLPGQNNGWWADSVPDEKAMLAQFQRRDYDAMKFATVRECHPDDARRIADKCRSLGYGAVLNNCLDHTCEVLGTYGVKDLPVKAVHPFPNDWFALFNGEYRNLETMAGLDS